MRKLSKIKKIAAMERMMTVPEPAVQRGEKVDLAEHVKGAPYRYRHGWVPRTPQIEMPARVNDSVLQAYSDNGYAKINNELRRTRGNTAAMTGHLDEGAFTLPTSRAVQLLDQSFGTLSAPTKVYRTVTPDALGLSEGDDPAKLIGKVIKDSGYLSTTTGRSSEMDAPISLELSVPKGVKAINMRPYSLNSFEEELLLSRNQEIKITGVKPDTRTSVNGVKRRYVVTGKVLLPSATRRQTP
jgi:hypothetical protein